MMELPGVDELGKPLETPVPRLVELYAVPVLRGMLRVTVTRIVVRTLVVDRESELAPGSWDETVVLTTVVYVMTVCEGQP